MKKISMSALFILLAVGLFAYEHEDIDKLLDGGKFEQAYNQLSATFDKDAPQAAVLWRMGRYHYEVSDKKPTKKEVIEGCEKGLDLLKDYLETSIGEPADRARVVQWYDVLLSRRGQAKGIKESLDRIPDFFAYADKANAICPTIPEPYHLKAMIDKELPTLFGGDKVRMAKNFCKAIECSPNVIVFLVDAADGFIGRNWDANKKVKNGDVYSPKGLSDKEYAKQLLEKALELGKNNDKLNEMDKTKLGLAQSLIKKVN